MESVARSLSALNMGTKGHLSGQKLNTGGNMYLRCVQEESGCDLWTN